MWKLILEDRKSDLVDLMSHFERVKNHLLNHINGTKKKLREDYFDELALCLTNVEHGNIHSELSTFLDECRNIQR